MTWYANFYETAFATYEVLTDIEPVSFQFEIDPEGRIPPLEPFFLSPDRFLSLECFFPPEGLRSLEPFLPPDPDLAREPFLDPPFSVERPRSADREDFLSPDLPR